MARLIIRCRKCKQEVTIDPNAVLEGQAVVCNDCTCHHLSKMVAVIQEAALRAWATAGEELAHTN